MRYVYAVYSNWFRGLENTIDLRYPTPTIFIKIKFLNDWNKYPVLLKVFSYRIYLNANYIFYSLKNAVLYIEKYYIAYIILSL